MVAIPLPSPANEPPEGWILGGIRNANALHRQNMENQYYGPMAQAEMNSKNAYAKYMPAQIAAQMMATPSFALLPREQQVAFAILSLWPASPRAFCPPRFS